LGIRVYKLALQKYLLTSKNIKNTNLSYLD